MWTVVLGLVLWLAGLSSGQAQLLEWATSAGGTNPEEGNGIAVDRLGNSYVTGRLKGTAAFGSGEVNETVLTSAGGDDLFVAKYDGAGALIWARRAGGMSIDAGFSIAVDDLGNSYVTGFFNDTATFGSGETNETVLTSAGLFDLFVAKYDGMGTLVWAKRAGGIEGDVGFGIGADGLGNSYVTGSFRGTVTFGPGEANETVLTGVGVREIFVAKYDSGGALAWARRAGGEGWDQGFGIAVDRLGNSYVTGAFGEQSGAVFGSGQATQTALFSAGDDDLFVAKYDSEGTLVWARRAGGPGIDVAFAIAVDGLGNSYVTGHFNGGKTTFGLGQATKTVLTSAGYFDLFVAKYNSEGTLMWARRAGGESFDRGFGIAVDRLGNSYVTGGFVGTATFGPRRTTKTVLTSAAGSFGLLVAKYDGEGTLVWATRAGGAHGGEGYSITVDGLGNSYVTGVFNGAAIFGSEEVNETLLTSTGSADLFVAKYGSEARDLAILRITAPTTVALTGHRPERLEEITVRLQNQSPRAETIPDAATLAALVSLRVEALPGAPNACPDLPAMLDASRLTFPLTLEVEGELKVPFEVTLTPDCIPDPAKGTKAEPGHEDYRLSATVDRRVLDGLADNDPVDDICPRTVTPPFRPDPNPDGTRKDVGCGKRKADKTFGAEVLVDVVGRE